MYLKKKSLIFFLRLKCILLFKHGGYIRRVRIEVVTACSCDANVGPEKGRVISFFLDGLRVVVLSGYFRGPEGPSLSPSSASRG